MSAERPDSRPPISGLRPPARPLAAEPEPGLTPPSFAPPPQAAGVAGPGWVWLALALLVATGLAVIFLLPGMQDASHPAQMPRQDPAAGSLTPVDAAAARLDAERELQALLRQRARLELADAGAWDEPDWSRAQEAAAAADELFQDGRYPEAAQGYARAFGSTLR